MRSKFKKYVLQNENARLLLAILAVFAVSRLIMAVMVPVYNTIKGTDRSFLFLMNEWDAKRYVYMIDNGYTFPSDTDPQANWAFFPLYFMVCKFIRIITFEVIDAAVVGIVVSNVCIIIAAFFAVKWLWMYYPAHAVCRRKQGAGADGMVGEAEAGNMSGNAGADGAVGEAGVRYTRIQSAAVTAALMFLAPYTFYCCSVYTEAMFIMFIVLFFYCASDRRYILAGVMSACASATRIVGCLLVFPMIMYLYADMVQGRVSFGGIGTFVKKMLAAPKRILAVLICPLGAFMYMTFLGFFCGDVWAYKNVQIAWREDEYFPIVGVLWKACTGQIEPRYTYMGWFCIAVFVLYAYMIYRKYYAMAAFGIISLLVPLTSHVMSTCRFTIGSYVVFVGLHDILMRLNKIVRWIIIVVLAAIEVYLLFLWYNSDCWLM